MDLRHDLYRCPSVSYLEKRHSSNEGLILEELAFRLLGPTNEQHVDVEHGKGFHLSLSSRKRKLLESLSIALSPFMKYEPLMAATIKLTPY